MRTSLITACCLMALTATAAQAQGRGRNTNGVPPGQRPPAGMCRVWIDGVPPGQQPAPTDCATARLNVPANGRVIYGENRTARANEFNRRVQLADGSWVVQRVRRDANGNLTVLSTRPLNGTTKVRRDRDNEGNHKNKVKGRDGDENDDDQGSIINGVRTGDRDEDSGREGHGRGKGHGKGKGHDKD